MEVFLPFFFVDISIANPTLAAGFVIDKNFHLMKTDGKMSIAQVWNIGPPYRLTGDRVMNEFCPLLIISRGKDHITNILIFKVHY